CVRVPPLQMNPSADPQGSALCFCYQGYSVDWPRIVVVETFGPTAGVHFPGSTGEFQSWFSTDADCLDYLDYLRWPAGFVCPRCEHLGGWAVADGRYKCPDCGGRTSVTAGTLFDRRRSP